MVNVSASPSGVTSLAGMRSLEEALLHRENTYSHERVDPLLFFSRLRGGMFQPDHIPHFSHPRKWVGDFFRETMFPDL